MKRGSIVQLKTGGPKMIVVSLDVKVKIQSNQGSVRRIQCHWFVDNILHEGFFTQEQLLILEE